MGKIIANRQLIDAQPTQPRRYGLFTAATVLDMPTASSRLVCSTSRTTAVTTRLVRPDVCRHHARSSR